MLDDLTFEDEVEEQVAAAYRRAYRKEATPEWLAALCLRVGTGGKVGTLDEAGVVAGVTRERVRQVTKRVLPLLKGVQIERARPIAERLAKHSPVAEPIGESLASTGLSRPTLTGAAFLNILKLVGVTPLQLVGTDLVRVDSWLVEESEVPVMGTFAMANRHTSSFGMTTVEEIRQALSTPDNPLDPGDVEKVLRSIPAVKWAGDWLWVEKGGTSEFDNSMLNVITQVLAVHRPQSLQSLREGVRRRFKFRRRDIIPPAEAMGVLLAQHPQFTVNGDLVSTIDELDYHDALGPSAAAVVDVFKASEYGAIDWQSLVEACEDVGVNPNSLTVWSSYAPWLEKVATRVFALRGSHPNPAAVAVIKDMAKRRTASEARRTEWSWDPSGRLRFTTLVTTALLGNGTLAGGKNRPAVASGREIRLTVSGEEAGFLKTSESHDWIWGLKKVLERLNAQVGQTFQVQIDLGSSSGEAHLGGQELWS